MKATNNLFDLNHSKSGIAIALSACKQLLRKEFTMKTLKVTKIVNAQTKSSVVRN